MDPELRISRSITARVVYGAIGFVFLGLGIAGYFVPGLPGTVNLLIALYFFSMSSRRMHQWMLTNRMFGAALRDYKTGLGIPRKIKIIAVSSIVVSVALSVGLVLDLLWVEAAVLALGVYGVWFVLSRPTREVELARRATATVYTGGSGSY